MYKYNKARQKKVFRKNLFVAQNLNQASFRYLGWNNCWAVCSASRKAWGWKEESEMD